MSSLPTPQEVALLVSEGILTKEEAREILISQETEEDRDKKSLQSEIMFLRELVEKLSNNRKTEIIRTIETVQTPYRRYDWFVPYYQYTSAVATNAVGSASTLTVGGSTTLNAGYASASGTNSLTALSGAAPAQFTAIKTF